MDKKYDVIIVGAGPGGIYTAYQLISNNKNLKVLVIDSGKELKKRVCPITNGKATECLHCKPCAIMQGYAGAGAKSDGKVNITNDFGGNLWEKVGKEKSLQLQKEVDNINQMCFKEYQLHQTVGSIVHPYPNLYQSSKSKYSKICLQNGMKLLNADIRHLGTDYNFQIMSQMYDILCNHGVEFLFETTVHSWGYSLGWNVLTEDKQSFTTKNLVLAVGRSGSKWLAEQCRSHFISVKSSRVDLGVRFELPYEVFSDLTDELYESKITYKTETFEDSVRTFCMNPHGIVVNENTNGITTVNGHSYEDPSKFTNNTNFALLVSQNFTEPFRDSNAYGESIAKLANQLSGGNVIVQRFGDLVKGRRSTKKDLLENTVVPTLETAVAGDISLCLPHRFCQDIIEMIYALDKVAPGTANVDNLLYATEVKFYNSIVDVDNNLEIPEYNRGIKDSHIYCIGDGSGWTHSLSQAAASGLYVGQNILKNF